MAGLPEGFVIDAGGSGPPPGFVVDSAGNVPPPQEKNGLATPGLQRGVFDKLLGLTGERYQLWPERAIREIASIPSRFGEIVSSPRLPQEEQAKQMVPLATEIATTFSPMSRAKAPNIGIKMGEAKPPAPSLQDVTKGAKDAYRELHQLDIQLQPDVVSGLSDSIKGLLMHGDVEADIQGGFRARNAPGTFDALEELRAPAGKNKLVKFADIDSVRQVLSRNAQARDPTTGGMTTDALASQIAIEHIDKYLENIPQFADAARRARGNWAAKSAAEMIERQEFRGEMNAATSGSGANLANTMRQKMKEVVVDTKKASRLTPEERELAEEIARGSKIANIARLVSKLGPKHPITGWGTALAADVSGGAGAATATMAIGAIAQYISEKAATGGVERLGEMIRRRSPAAGTQPTGPRFSIQGDLNSMAPAGVIAPLLGMSAQQRALQDMGRDQQ